MENTTASNPKPKNTIYFYVGLLVLVGIAIGLGLMFNSNEKAIQEYIGQGYEEEEVRAYLTTATVIQQFLTYASPFFVVAAIMFAINSILKRLDSFAASLSRPTAQDEKINLQNSPVSPASENLETDSAPEPSGPDL